MNGFIGRCWCLLQAMSLDAAGRIEEVDRMRSEERQLLTSLAEAGLTEVTVQSSPLNLDSLSSEWSELSSTADEKARTLSASLSHWNLYQSALSTLMPCLNHAEQYVSAAKSDTGIDVSAKTGSPTEAQKLLDEHQVCPFHSSVDIDNYVVCLPILKLVSLLLKVLVIRYFVVLRLWSSSSSCLFQAVSIVTVKEYRKKLKDRHER